MTQHHITLIFEDGVTSVVAAGPGETVYQAAARQNVPIQTDCREGACAVCAATCVSGTYDLLDFSDEALTPQDQARGGVLACRMRATSDCVLEMPYPSGAIALKDAAARAVVVSELDEVAQNVVRLVLSEADGVPMAFLPGQYVNIEVPGTGRARSYSFANAPLASGGHEFFIRRLDRGLMSDWLAAGAAAGIGTQISAPRGQFFLRPTDRPLLMVAGGTGLAPMLSMLAHIKSGGGPRPAKITVLYGTNTAGEMFGLDRLAELSGDLPIEVRTAVVSPPYAGTVGHVTGLLEPQMLEGGETQVYLCGPPPMVQAARAFLDQSNHPARHIFAERFLPSAA